MPQISLPDIKFKELSERLQDARNDVHLPDDLRHRLDDLSESIADAGNRIGDEVGDRVSDIRWSDIRLPAFNLPAAIRELTLPNMRAPKVDMPRMDIPKDIPKNLRRELAKLDIPITFGKPKPSSPPMAPFVVLAAVAGVAVGWWLATSEYASARIRSMVQEARVRAGLAHDWDETVEERTEDFWSGQRGWQTGGEPDEGGTGTGEGLGIANRRGWGTTEETMSPSGSISGDGGTAGEEDQQYATAGATSTLGGDTIGGTWAEGSADDAAGGTGYEPDRR